MEGEMPPKADLAEIEEFESKRAGYFAEEYVKTSLYWSSLRDLMEDNEGSTRMALDYVADKLETDRVYTSAVYANADKLFGDKKGASKLRHNQIRYEETKAKAKGKEAPMTEDSLKAGGSKKEAPPIGTMKALWEMAEMDCRAARHRDMLCEELENEEMLGKVKTMSKETNRKLKELSDAGEACLLSLRNIDKRVGQSFLHLKEVLGSQLGGRPVHEDVWFLDCSYRTAVFHQKEAWAAVSDRLGEVFNQMKTVEASRRDTLRTFLMAANTAIGNTWAKLPAFCAAAVESAEAVDAGFEAVERDVSARASLGVQHKMKTSKNTYQLANTTKIAYAQPPPADASFIDSLTAPLDSPLVRSTMVVERREGKTIGSKYYTGLLIISWDGFIHFFDVPKSTGLKADVSPAAAFQGISPTISLDDLVSNKKDLEEVLLFKSTASLQLDEESEVVAVSSHKSHKLDVTGTKEVTSSIKRAFGAGTKHKTITFRTKTEAEMNHALDLIKACIQAKGGMMVEGQEKPEQLVRVSTGSRSSFGSTQSEPGPIQEPAKPEPAAEPVPAPPMEEPSPVGETSEEPAPVEKAAPDAPPAPAAEPAPAASGEGSAEVAAPPPAAEKVFPASAAAAAPEEPAVEA